ncbi:MAG: ATP-grasp domain-containing protein [Spirochaetales bacterium]|nr:ATP-grasp domain-containing protein [Spirochaetales bacterium]
MEKRILPAQGNIGILNRGEAALRFVRAVREYNILQNTMLKTVAFYLPEEEEAPFVRQADMAFCFSRLKGKGVIDRNVYLNREQLGEAMDTMECIAAWVGWGFLSEEASFIEFLEEKGIVFIGPSSKSVALLGDKIAAKELAEANDVPVTPWSKGPVKSAEEAMAFADAIGYPCMIKAALAGGGRGIRRVNSPRELKAKFESAREETLRVTGNTLLFIEQVVETGRHLEVQALADHFGNVVTFGVRDCSIQRRNQKIIEETPPPNMDPATIENMEACSMRLLKAASYQNAGTVEFLFDLKDRQFYFMEVNTRLQVEHPITEQAFGVDIVHGQLDVAMGKKLSEHKRIPQAVAVEVRLNAEDPDRGFTPSPGKVLHFQIPAGPGVRVDSGITQETIIPAEFDSMVAKIIAYGPARDLAYARLHRALKELQIKIEKGTTNHAFLMALLRCPEIQHGGVHTRFVEELLEKNHEIIVKNNWNIAIIVAALEQYIKNDKENLINFKQQLIGTGYPRTLPASRGMEVDMTVRGQLYRLLVKATGPDSYLVQSGDVVIALEYNSKLQGALLKIGECYHQIQTILRGSDLQVEVDGIPYLIELESGGTIKAPSPALVVSIQVQPGQMVESGQLLVILEAMKMEMIVQAPESGTVKEIFVRTGEQIAAGQALILLDTTGESGPDRKWIQPESERIQFKNLINDDNEWNIIAREFYSVFLGYDHDPSIQAIYEKAVVYPRNEQDDQKLVSLFLSVLKAYIEIEGLFFSPPVASEKLSRLTSYRELLSHYFRRQGDREKGLPESFLGHLHAALQLYFPGNFPPGSFPAGNLPSGKLPERSNDEAVYHLYASHHNLSNKQKLLQKTLLSLEYLPVQEEFLKELSDRLDALILISQKEVLSLSDTAIHIRYQLIDKVILQNWKEEKRENTGKIMERLFRYDKNSKIYTKLIEFIMENKYHLLYDLVQKARAAADPGGEKDTHNEYHLIMEILARHMCNDREFLHGTIVAIEGIDLFYCKTKKNKESFHTYLTIIKEDNLINFIHTWTAFMYDKKNEQSESPELIILINWKSGMYEESLFKIASSHPLPVLWMSLGLLHPEGKSEFRTYHHKTPGTWEEDIIKRGFNPRAFREFRIYRLINFEQEIIYSSEFVHLLRLQARENPRDERLFATVEVPSIHLELDENGNILRMVALEYVFMEAVYIMRAEQAKRKRRLQWNRIIIHIDRMINITPEQIEKYASKIITRAHDLGIERILIYSRREDPVTSELTDIEVNFDLSTGSGFVSQEQQPDEDIILPADTYATKIVIARHQQNIYPYKILKMITRKERGRAEIFPAGSFEEYDITVDATTHTQGLIPVKGRRSGENTCNIVFGIITNSSESFPDGIKRVILLSDSTQNMGSLAEPECRRIIAALDLAERENLPLEWLPISAGARIDMKSGTENLDWTAQVLRKIIQATQAGREINIIVLGINIGAQSYWNAEATMLMHTRGMLIMSENASMLLTGKKALDFSGSVSAETNEEIGGAEHIMEPNGQAQVRVKDIYEAYTTLFTHYSITYCRPGQKYPAPFHSVDPQERDICKTPYNDLLKQGFTTIGDIFSGQVNPERKKPFDMHQLMKAVVDTDSPVCERWRGMKDAEMAIVWESRIGGYAVGLLGIQSQPLARIGGIPHDGPEVWSGGTLFPLSSKKLARGINAFSGNLPLVIFANLSGFDGSPESLRKLQLEYGAEIGRAVVNFRGPVFFIVTSRYHGGAYVVFSKTLNPGIRIAAFEGAFASVIGGAPAAAVVFPRQVLKNTYADPVIIEAQKHLSSGLPSDQKNYEELFQQVYSEKQRELAKEFDSVHTVERAQKVGSIDDIITPSQARPYLIGHLKNVYEADGKPHTGDALDFTYG